MAPSASRAQFVRAHTRLRPVPLVPEISLHVADEATALWHKTEEELGAIGLPPPYWAFAWAGGQALARYLLDHVGLVAGRRVADIGTGSGLVAIAAAKAGAAAVTGFDTDAFAVAAATLNAEANRVTLDVRLADPLQSGLEGIDLVLVGDLFYERPLAERLGAWIEGAAATARVLIGDPGRSYLPRDRLERLAEYSVPTTRALEDLAIKRTGVWTLAAPAPPTGEGP